MRKEVGREKREWISTSPNSTMREKIGDFSNDARACLGVENKQERSLAISALNNKAKDAIKADPSAFGLEDGSEAGKEAYKGIDELLYNMMRNDILKEGK
jgi:polyribonucleotide nucleotidyltransferase